MDVCLRFPVLCCPVQVEALRRADHPSNESYQLAHRFTSKNPSTPQGKRGRLSKKETKSFFNIDGALITVSLFFVFKRKSLSCY
jgi:hypothetical protein